MLTHITQPDSSALQQLKLSYHVQTNWSSYQSRSEMVNKGALHKEHKGMRAVCAAVVLDLRVSWWRERHGVYLVDMSKF